MSNDWMCLQAPGSGLGLSDLIGLPMQQPGQQIGLGFSIGANISGAGPVQR